MPSKRAATLHLRRHDPVLAAVIERVGAYRLVPRRDGTHFAFLLRSILYQQLSGKAAATIHARFLALFAGGEPTADALLALSDDALRGAGVSRQKIGYMRDLARCVASGEVAVETVDGLEDEPMIELLTRVKGIGRWTVQMFLMFRLGRLDVLPEVDFGIRKAIKNEYRLRSMPTPKRVRTIAARWAPYRTVACWYLWRTLD